MASYDSVYDLLMNPEHILRLREGEDRAAVNECIEHSAGQLNDWMHKMGFTDDSKIEAGWCIHHALHIAFGSCDIGFIASRISLLLISGKEQEALQALSLYFMIGMMVGSAFVLEAQERGMPGAMPAGSEAISDRMAKLMKRWDDVDSAVNAIPFPLDLNQVLDEMHDELSKASDKLTSDLFDELDHEADLLFEEDAKKDADGPILFDELCPPDDPPAANDDPPSDNDLPF